MILLAAWVFAALNVAMHFGAHDFGVWFWVNAALMLLIPLVGMATARDAR